MRSLKLVIFLSAIAIASSDGITSNSSHQLSVSGNSVRINCSNTGAGGGIGARWERNLLGSVTTEPLSDRTVVDAKFRDRMFVVNDHPGQHDLIINQTQLGDAGVYTCISLTETNEIIRTTELVVVDSSPLCYWNTTEDWIMEGDDVLISCNISYNSNNSHLVIQWNGCQESRSSCIDTKHPFVRTCTMFVVVHSSNIASFRSTCSLSVMLFGNETVNHQSPCEYKSNASVHFAPRNIKYHPIKDSYEVGDVITCSVESQPPSKYTWFNNNSDVVSNGSSVTVGSDMGWLNCVARNEHGNMSINVIVAASKTDGYDDFYWAIAITTACLVLIAIIILLSRNRKRDVATSKVSTMTGMNKPDIVSETPSGSDDRNNENANDFDSRQQYWNANDVDAHFVVNDYEAIESLATKSLENVPNTTQTGKRSETRPSTLVPTEVVYAVVDKNRKKGIVGGNTVTVSAEVHEQTQDDSIQMGDLGRLHSNRPRHSPNVNETVQGGDGTIYTQLGSRAPPRTPRRNQPPRTVPETNEYASVAHNLEIPPPLPPANNR